MSDLPYGLHYQTQFVTPAEKVGFQKWLKEVHPIWEFRTESQLKQLLRPVYWLGVWQFACFGYYRPPKGVLHRAVWAERYPPFLESMVKRIEKGVHRNFRPRDIPKGWHLNCCLVNFYGSRQKEEGRWEDMARVGEHKDDELGPVASISFGDRALFQFVSSHSRFSRSQVKLQQWLEECSLQVFGGERFKRELFHRVQRVEKKKGLGQTVIYNDFAVRRVNFTLRFVADEHVGSIAQLPKERLKSILPYLRELAIHSKFFKEQLEIVVK